MESNKMKNMPVPKLLLNMGIPSVLSLMFSAVYNIVDSIFVSHMTQNGEAALTALALAYPAQILIVALSIGTGAGALALLSRGLGERNQEKVNLTAGNALFLGGVIYLACLLFGLFGVNTFIHSQTKNPLVAEMAVKYLKINSILSFGIIFYTIVEKMLQATGRTVFSTIAATAGTITNLILDPVLIYGIGKFPAMGIAGAAYATVAGQMISLLLGVVFHIRLNKEIQNHWKNVRLSWHVIAAIYKIGIPAIISQALLSVMNYGLNIIFGGIGESVVTVYGLYYKIQQLMLFAAFGMRDVITPVVSFAYGMRKKERIREGMKYGILFTAILMIAGTILIELFSGSITMLFGLSGETEQICITALRVASLSFLFAGINVAYQAIVQGLDGGSYSLLISICRQFLFVLPLAYWFSWYAKREPGALWLIWCTFLIAELVTVGIGTICIRRNWKQVKEICEKM